MNRTRIEWTDWTWNPITGCKHDCWYCYAHKMFTRFHRSWEPTFHPERLDEIDHLRKPAKVFVCSVADLFARWTKPEWRDAVLNKILDPKYAHLTFQLLTKAPEEIPNFDFPSNVWVGVTVTTQAEVENIDYLRKTTSGCLPFASFEPLLGTIDLDDDHLRFLKWIIIGKLTGSARVKLDPEWVNHLIGCAETVDLPVFVKDSIVAELGEKYRIREFPKP